MDTQKLNIVFAGTPDFALPALESLINSPHAIIAVYTQPDRPAGRGKQIQISPVKQLAQSHQIPVFQPQSLKDEKEQQILKNLNPDLIIVAAYGLILPKLVLEIPQLGCINIHASILPRFRGASPIHQAILSGDKETGVTIMQMDVGLDTGDMLYHLNCAIESKETLKTLHDKLAVLGAKAILHVLENIEIISPEKQDNSLTTHAPKILKSDTFLNFQQHTAIQCERMIRAYYPAQITIENQVIKIWEADVIDNPENLSALPGQIIAANKQGIDIQTKEGILRCKKCQLAGGKILNAHEILNARKELFAVGKICAFSKPSN